MTSKLHKIRLLGVAVFAYAGFTYADEIDPNFALVSPQVKHICQSLAETPIPTGDQPNASFSNTLKKCDPSDLYYGLNQPVDFIKARQCAYVQQDYPTLTMIYANGKGVPRNWDLAIHFACKAGFSADEIEGRVMHLVQLRNQHAQSTNFDICDDITSGYMMGVCASQKDQLAEAQLSQQLAQLTASWNEGERQAFRQLQQAAHQFFEARSAHEVDLTGTGRAAFEIEETAALRDDFIASLNVLSHGHYPVYTANQAAQMDQQLNKIYKEIEKNNDFSVGTVSRLDVKKTQLSWLKYRDAWMTFVKTKYPQVDTNSWETELTKKRIKMLEDLVESNE